MGFELCCGFLSLWHAAAACPAQTVRALREPLLPTTLCGLSSPLAPISFFFNDALEGFPTRFAAAHSRATNPRLSTSAGTATANRAEVDRAVVGHENESYA